MGHYNSKPAFPRDGQWLIKWVASTGVVLLVILLAGYLGAADAAEDDPLLTEFPSLMLVRGSGADEVAGELMGGHWYDGTTPVLTPAPTSNDALAPSEVSGPVVTMRVAGQRSPGSLYIFIEDRAAKEIVFTGTCYSREGVDDSNACPVAIDWGPATVTLTILSTYMEIGVTYDVVVHAEWEPHGPIVEGRPAIDWRIVSWQLPIVHR